jgi:hypothetical protein
VDVEDKHYPGARNSLGTPLYKQAGRDGIRDFDAIVSALPPTLRAAFEAERTAQQRRAMALSPARALWPEQAMDW